MGGHDLRDRAGDAKACGVGGEQARIHIQGERRSPPAHLEVARELTLIFLDAFRDTAATGQDHDPLPYRQAHQSVGKSCCMWSVVQYTAAHLYENITNRAVRCKHANLR